MAPRQVGQDGGGSAAAAVLLHGVWRVVLLVQEGALVNIAGRVQVVAIGIVQSLQHVRCHGRLGQQALEDGAHARVAVWAAGFR